MSPIDRILSQASDSSAAIPVLNDVTLKNGDDLAEWIARREYFVAMMLWASVRNQSDKEK